MRYTKWVSLAVLIAVSFRAAPAVAGIVEPHGTVGGKTLEQWSAEWWQQVFALPVYAADGTTITHPQFDAGINPGDTVNATHTRPSDDGQVTFLFGSFSGGVIVRSVTVPSGKPIFVPILNDEWSNPDTAASPTFTTYPGNYTQAELAAFAKTETDFITDIHASLDGQDVPDMLSHRETSPNFSYTLPASHSVIKTFFGLDITGPVPSAADGYYLMLEPLSPGQHTLKFSGSIPDHSDTPPLLGGFSVDTTYHINVADGAIPLPASVWAALSVLPLAGFAVRRARLSPARA